MAGTARRIRDLVELATGRFYACEFCRSDALTYIEDLLAPLQLSLREEKRLLRALRCPECGARIRSWTQVLAASEEQVRHSELSRRFDRRYGQQLEGFKHHLVRFPMLGCLHPFGRSLDRALMRVAGTKLEPATWYRAAKYRPEEPPLLEARPSPQVTRANRFNQMGQVAWYLGVDRETAAVEVLRAPAPQQHVWIADVEILETIDVLDLRTALWGQDPAGHWILRNVVDRRFISEPVADDDPSCPQYRVPQFVGDLARKRGFRGVLYDSSRPSAYNNPEAFGHNLVLFDPLPTNARRAPRLYTFEERTPDIHSPGLWDLLEVDEHTY